MRCHQVSYYLFLIAISNHFERYTNRPTAAEQLNSYTKPFKKTAPLKLQNDLAIFIGDGEKPSLRALAKFAMTAYFLTLFKNG